MPKLIHSNKDYGETPDYERGFVYRDFDGTLHWTEGIVEEGVAEGDTDFFYFDRNGARQQLAAEFLRIGSMAEHKAAEYATMEAPGYVHNETQRDKDATEDDEDDGDDRDSKKHPLKRIFIGKHH